MRILVVWTLAITAVAVGYQRNTTQPFFFYPDQDSHSNNTRLASVAEFEMSAWSMEWFILTVSKANDVEPIAALHLAWLFNMPLSENTERYFEQIHSDQESVPRHLRCSEFCCHDYCAAEQQCGPDNTCRIIMVNGLCECVCMDDDPPPWGCDI